MNDVGVGVEESVVEGGQIVVRRNGTSGAVIRKRERTAGGPQASLVAEDETGETRRLAVGHGCYLVDGRTALRAFRVASGQKRVGRGMPVDACDLRVVQSPENRYLSLLRKGLHGNHRRTELQFVLD